jgi:hypothetical protein
MNAARHHSLAALASAALLALFAAAPARAAEVKLPTGEVVKQVDFERHVMGLFGRMGCNAGSCHGSFQGKGGFRLSLFGYEPDRDYEALTHDAQGRRINPADPDSSLLLLKATGAVEHGGTRRFSRDSWAYQLLREWIAQGAPRRKGSGDVKSISIQPPEYAFAKPGQDGQVRVEATFTDGSRENITVLCDFRTNDEAIVEVDNLGRLKSIRPGDTAVIVSYRGNVLPVRVMVPLEAAPGFKYPDVPEVNYVDHEVFAKLRRLNMVPSDLCSDTEFLRRVSLDTIGTLPTPKEVRDFLADDRPDKRARKIDELLAHPMHAALWATKFSDVTGNNTDQLENPQQFRPKRSQMWHDWLRKRFADNTPYDRTVHDILCATSRDGETPEDWIKQTNEIEEEAGKGFKTKYAERKTLDLYWRRQQQVPIDQWGEKTAAAFLGVRLECAQCHKHPFDRWTQADYRSYANIFAVVKVDPNSPDCAKAITAENNARRQAQAGKPNQQLSVLRELYIGRPGPMLPHPDTNAVLAPKALGGPEIKVEAGKDPREALFDWMDQKDNPFFARAFVNRVWGHYFGVGIVHPVDDFSLANPPSNPKLLDALARDFVESGYDVRRLERTILMSRTYQLSSTPNDTNRLDKTNYSRSYVRPLMAEVVVDLLNTAMGTEQKWGNDAPAGARAIEVGASRVTDPTVAYAFRIFGRPPRTTACDCERSLEAGLPQKLYLIADPAIKSKLEEPNNRLKKLLADYPDDNAALDELFLATQTRLPTDRERAAFARLREKTPDRTAAFRSALWAVVNTNEFIFNH